MAVTRKMWQVVAVLAAALLYVTTVGSVTDSSQVEHNVSPTSDAFAAPTTTTTSVAPTTSMTPAASGVPALSDGGGSVGQPATTSMSTSGIKPQLTGIINENGPVPSGYESVVHNFMVEAPWSSLQASLDGPITADNPIDQAITTAQQDNLRIFVDVQAGEYAPAWAKNLPVTTGAQGPFTICNDNGVTTSGSSVTVCGTMPHWWETDYQNAYANLMSQLAAKYDNVPQVAMVGIDGCMTIFNEPLVRETTPISNIASYEQAGFTASGDEQCEEAQINAMKPWVHTLAYLSFNPYEQWTGSGFTINEAFTEGLMTYCRQVLGQRCVLGNESVGNGSSRIIPASTYSCNEINDTSPTWKTIGYYDRMYTMMRCLGSPISMRSANPIKLAGQNLTLGTVIPWAISYGVGSFQVPFGYDEPANPAMYLTTSQVSTYDTHMAANSSPAQ